MDHLREYVKEWIEFTRENSSSAAKMDDDELFDVVEELEDDIKELKKLVSDLRVDVAKKRDK